MMTQLTGVYMATEISFEFSFIKYLNILFSKSAAGRTPRSEPV